MFNFDKMRKKARNRELYEERFPPPAETRR